LLEGEQDAPAQRHRVVERLQPRCMRGPLVVTEVGVRGAAGNEHKVIGQRGAVGQRHALRSAVDGSDLAQAHGDIALAGQDVAQRRGDVAGRQAGRRHLVEQRLKEVVVGAIDERDLQRRRSQRACAPQASEATADDDEMRLLRSFHAQTLAHFHRCADWGTPARIRR
jgi:hypothetical protein